MFARDTVYARTRALTVLPSSRLAMISAQRPAAVFDGRPSLYPSLFAGANPDCERSTNSPRTENTRLPSGCDDLIAPRNGAGGDEKTSRFLQKWPFMILA